MVTINGWYQTYERKENGAEAPRSKHELGQFGHGRSDLGDTAEGLDARMKLGSRGELGLHRFGVVLDRERLHLGAIGHVQHAVDLELDVDHVTSHAARVQALADDEELALRYEDERFAGLRTVGAQRDDFCGNLHDEIEFDE